MTRIALFCILLSHSLLSWADQPIAPPTRFVDHEYSVGHQNSDIVIYEYGSLTCHVCAKFYLKVLPHLLEKYGHRVKFVLRPFPFNALDIMGAQLVLYGKDPHKIAEALYKAQKEWIGAKDQRQALKDVAKKAGMDKKTIQQAVQDKNLERASLAKRLVFKDIKSAPVFKVGKSTLEGLPQKIFFEKMIDALIKHKEEGSDPEDFDADAFFKNLPDEPQENNDGS